MGQVECWCASKDGESSARGSGEVNADQIIFLDMIISSINAIALNCKCGVYAIFVWLSVCLSACMHACVYVCLSLKGHVT